MEQHEIDGIKNLLLSGYEPNVQVGFNLLKYTFTFTQKQVNIFIIDNVLPVVFDMICLVLQKYCKETFSEHLTKIHSGTEIIYYEYLYNNKKEGMYRVLFRDAKTSKMKDFTFFLSSFIYRIQNTELNTSKECKKDIEHISGLLEIIRTNLEIA